MRRTCTTGTHSRTYGANTSGDVPETVLMINPIYNADGNERVSVSNRGSQAGPVGGMGTRENAQGLDLNRDGTKMETAEARDHAAMAVRIIEHAVVTRVGRRQRGLHARNVKQAAQLHRRQCGSG